MLIFLFLQPFHLLDLLGTVDFIKELEFATIDVPEFDLWSKSISNHGWIWTPVNWNLAILIEINNLLVHDGLTGISEIIDINLLCSGCKCDEIWVEVIVLEFWEFLTFYLDRRYDLFAAYIVLDELVIWNSCENMLLWSPLDPFTAASVKYARYWVLIHKGIKIPDIIYIDWVLGITSGNGKLIIFIAW